MLNAHTVLFGRVSSTVRGTIQEVGLPAAWTADGLVCEITNALGIVDGGSAAADGTVEADLVAGDALSCIQTNLAPASVDVAKTVDGTGTDWNSECTNQSRPGR